MGALSKLQSAVTRKFVPESGSTALATQSMGVSAKTLEIVAKGNGEGSRAMVIAANTIGKHHNTQAATAEVGKRMGRIKAWADQMEMLKPIIEAGAKDYARGTLHQTSMAKTLAKTSQTVAILNSGAQYDMSKNHQSAGIQVAINQSAYGGAGWSA